MSAPAAIQGDYTDLKFVKGRKVCQITIEIPMEAGADFVQAFGTPNPATGVPVALARIDLNAKPERKGGKLAQKAALISNQGGFQKYVGATNADEAAEHVRKACGVMSRADLDHNEKAAALFRDLETSYEAWLKAA